MDGCQWPRLGPNARGHSGRLFTFWWLKLYYNSVTLVSRFVFRIPFYLDDIPSTCMPFVHTENKFPHDLVDLWRTRELLEQYAIWLKLKLWLVGLSSNDRVACTSQELKRVSKLSIQRNISIMKRGRTRTKKYRAADSLLFEKCNPFNWK